MDNRHTVAVQLVTYNSAAFLPALAASIHAQTYDNTVIVVVDNASTDNSVALIRQLLPTAILIENTENRGFSAAHNQAIAATDAPYACLVNPDMELTPTALQTLVALMDHRPDVGSCSGKLLNFSSEYGTIDSAGLLATRYREFVNRGEGEADHGQCDHAEAVFGLSGAFVLLRRTALLSIRIGDEFLDEDLFMYKDDVDLAWRLQLAGWINWYEPRAVLYHQRTARHESERSIRDRRTRKSVLVNRLSYRNHLLVLIKNGRVRDWFLPWPRVFFMELLKLVFLPIFEPSTLPAVPEVFHLAPRMLVKRRHMRSLQRVSSNSLAHWFQ